MKSRQIYRGIIILKYYSERYSESTSLQYQSQHWGDESEISMEGITPYYLNHNNIVREVSSLSVFY